MYTIPTRVDDLEIVDVTREGNEVLVLWADGWATVYRYSPDRTINLIRYLPPHRYQLLQQQKLKPPVAVPVQQETIA